MRINIIVRQLVKMFIDQLEMLEANEGDVTSENEGVSREVGNGELSICVGGLSTDRSLCIS